MAARGSGGKCRKAGEKRDGEGECEGEKRAHGGFHLCVRQEVNLPWQMLQSKAPPSFQAARKTPDEWS
ncbi:MAG: hypothetical protein Devi2KO_18860 [Devosia indica]